MGVVGVWEQSGECLQICENIEGIAGQTRQNLNNTFCSVSRGRKVLAAFLKES
jgi:hypothetical protein